MRIRTVIGLDMFGRFREARVRGVRVRERVQGRAEREPDVDGLLVAILDLIPLAGATLAAIIVTTVAVLEDPFPAGVFVFVFFVVYQQLENHILQPVIYGRTVQLSPLTVLVAVLIGAELVGILGALAAIPTAGIVQAVAREIFRWRREAIVATGGGIVKPDMPTPET